MDETEQLAKSIFIAFLQSKGPDGGSAHYTTLAGAAFKAAESFEHERDERQREEGMDVFSSAAVSRQR